MSHELNRFARGVRRGPRRHHAASMIANDALGRSLYGRQLRRLFEHFPRQQVLVLQYERCVADPSAELRRTYEFLGLGEVDHVPGFLAARRGTAHPQIPPPEAITGLARERIKRDLADLESLVPGLDLELWPSAAATH